MPSRFGIEPLVEIVNQTARYDAELLQKFGPLQASDSDSFGLLAALWERWPNDKFDEINICVAAPYDRRLWCAVEFLGPLRKQRIGVLRLSPKNEREIRRWLVAVAGREINGLMLDREPSGWCDIVFADTPARQ